MRTRVLTAIGGFTIVTAAAFGQTTPGPVFEAADVHAAPPAANQFLQAHSAPSGRYELRNATMLDLIRTAYNIEPEMVYGGPSWLDSDRFDVIAKAPARSSDDDRRLMLRALLADRVKLVVHNETKPADVFTLTAGKKVLLKESDSSGPFQCAPPQQTPGQQPPYAVLNCSGMTMGEFATQFHQFAGGYLVHPVADATGLKGRYDFTIQWSGRGRLIQLQANPDPNAETPISFFEAAEKQLGLKLTPEKRPMPVIVVDSVERTPAPNPPGVKTNILAVPTEFDAAVIKPSKPNNPNRRFQPKAGGELDIENVPLKMLIGASWSLEGDLDRVVGGPKWIDSENFDIVAKTSDFPVNSPPPIDSVRIMLRNLLIERFKLQAHTEDRMIPMWLLTVAKSGPKLKPADPQSRSACKPQLGAAGAGAGTAPLVSMVCTNTTMAQFAEQAHRAAGAYIDKIAADVTGLQGGYDFTISWTPKGLVTGANRSGDGSSDTASDPSGGATFFDAAEKQLGLHLEMGKHSAPVLVVDKVEHFTGGN